VTHRTYSIYSKPALIGGFTIVELIATVAIAALLLAVGVPSLLRLISSSAITGYADSLTGDLALARSEAIVEKSTVTICKSADLLNCDLPISGTGTKSWTNGWIVFSDVDGNYTVDLPDDRIIRVHEALSAQVELSFNRGTYLQYGYKGNLDSSPGTFTFCPVDKDEALARGLIVAATGRTRNSVDSDADNIHEDGSGGALTCP
jgi:Tfp pilus assembly protein FimT